MESKREAGLTGIPLMVKIKRVVIIPVAGIPASPRVATATVTLKRKSRGDHKDKPF